MNSALRDIDAQVKSLVSDAKAAGAKFVVQGGAWQPRMRRSPWLSGPFARSASARCPQADRAAVLASAPRRAFYWPLFATCLGAPRPALPRRLGVVVRRVLCGAGGLRPCRRHAGRQDGRGVPGRVPSGVGAGGPVRSGRAGRRVRPRGCGPQGASALGPTSRRLWVPRPPVAAERSARAADGKPGPRSLERGRFALRACGCARASEPARRAELICDRPGCAARARLPL